MLEKFLPFLKQPEKPRRNLEGQPYIPDKNLFYNPDSLREEASAAGVVIKFSSAVIIFFSIAVIVLLTVHTSMNFLIKEAHDEQRNLENKMKMYEGVEEFSTEAAEKIDYAKKAVGIRKPLTARISFVMSDVPEAIKIKEFKVNPVNFNLAVESARTTDITRLIMKWLQEGGVSEVSIKEASYSSSKGIYTVGLQGVYR